MGKNLVKYNINYGWKHWALVNIKVRKNLHVVIYGEIGKQPKTLRKAWIA